MIYCKETLKGLLSYCEEGYSILANKYPTVSPLLGRVQSLYFQGEFANAINGEAMKKNFDDEIMITAKKIDTLLPDEAKGLFSDFHTALLLLVHSRYGFTAQGLNIARKLLKKGFSHDKP